MAKADVQVEIKSGDLSKEQLQSVKNITGTLTEFFAGQAKKIAAKVSALYAEATKKDTPQEKADRIINAVNMEEWDLVATELQDDLGGAFEQTAQVILGKLDISDPDIFDLVNERSVEYADETAADLVTQISETTRDRLRSLVADAIENAQGVNELKAAIQDSELFSADRAELIARTEIGNAHMAGALEGAKASGLAMMKMVLRGSQEFDCEICGDNEDAGLIGLTELFPSGDEAPLFHPRCECTIIFSVASVEAGA